MTSPILALRAAIHARCLADPALAAAMGGSVRLYDEPPRGATPVYALYGTWEARDASTSSGRAQDGLQAGAQDRAHEHAFALVVWAPSGSAASGLAVAERIAGLLDDAPLSLAGHRLVHLSVAALESARDPQSGLACVSVRLRALTETN